VNYECIRIYEMGLGPRLDPINYLSLFWLMEIMSSHQEYRIYGFFMIKVHKQRLTTKYIVLKLRTFVPKSRVSIFWYQCFQYCVDGSVNYECIRIYEMGLGP